MKILSWNVNGLRAALGKGFVEKMRDLDPDVICIQETKMQPGQAQVDLPGYKDYWNSAEKKGYSGTAVFTRRAPLSVACGMGDPVHDREGRLLTLEFEDFFLCNCYAPNSQSELARLSYRMEWEDAARTYLRRLDAEKPVVLCGDLNVAHREIDHKNPQNNNGTPAF